jgi:proteic killer suppression protein
VIVSFADKATEDLFHGSDTSRVRRFPPDVVEAAIRKFDMMNAVDDLGELRLPPGNRLKKLRGDLREFHSLRVNDQWRIVFRWSPQGPQEVKLTDYHD